MDKKTSKNNFPLLGQMKKKYSLFIFIALLLITSLLLNISNSFALTLTGTDQVTTGSTQYAVSGCDGTVTWSAGGVGTSINQNGTITIESTACGAIIIANCSDGTTATKEIGTSGTSGIMGWWVSVYYCLEGIPAPVRNLCYTGKEKIEGEFKYGTELIYYNYSSSVPGNTCIAYSTPVCTCGNNPYTCPDPSYIYVWVNNSS